MFSKIEPYPIDKTELFKRLLKESTTTPLKFGMSYFQNYLEKGGDVEHPILGNLAEFVKAVETRWDHNKLGSNLIVGLLKSRLDINTENAGISHISNGLK